MGDRIAGGHDGQEGRIGIEDVKERKDVVSLNGCRPLETFCGAISDIWSAWLRTRGPMSKGTSKLGPTVQRRNYQRVTARCAQE